MPLGRRSGGAFTNLLQTGRSWASDAANADLRFHCASAGNASVSNLRLFLRKGLMAMFERTRTGLREMPSNAAWLVSRALKPAENATTGARDQGRKVTAAVVDAAPVGDSVEIRARRARVAAERAREAEERAVEAARESKAQADRAREVGERGQARIKDVEREASREVKQRVAEAEKAAAEFVKRERQEAEADAE